MPEVEITTDEKGKQKARIKPGALDIPRPHTIIFKTTVPSEYETIHLTKEQYKGIMQDLESGQSGLSINGRFYDRFRVFDVR